MIYTIYDNKLNAYKLEFNSDNECISFMKRHYAEFIYSIHSSDSLTVVRPNGYILAYINPTSGVMTIKSMGDWLNEKN